MVTLLRYWLIPGRIRRAPIAARLILLTPALFCLLVLLVNPVSAFGPGTHFGWYSGFTVCGVAWNLCSPVTCLFGLLVGAISVAPERQHQRWESLMLTRLRITEILHAKMTTCLFQGAAFLLPPFLALMHMNFQATLGGDDWVRGGSWPILRSPERWYFTESFLRLATFTLIGMAVSAACRRVQTALSVCGGLVAAYVGIYVACTRIYGYYPYPDDDYLHAHLCYWPIMPAHTYDLYRWRWKLISDLVWGVALPIVCYVLIRLLCRRPRARHIAVACLPPTL